MQGVTVEGMMKKSLIAMLIAALIPASLAAASQEEFLEWTSAAIECANTPEAGDVSCEIKVGEDGWETCVIKAFGNTHRLGPADLRKLDGFPLSSLRTSHEAGYEELGGYTVHFRLDRTFYNADNEIVTEIIYVSVTRDGVTVSEPRAEEH